MMEPTFDRNGYPTAKTLERIETWLVPADQPAFDQNTRDCLMFMCKAWKYPGAAKEVVPGRFVFAPLGWSSNEDLLGAFGLNPLHVLVHQLHLDGGFSIYAVGKEATEELHIQKSHLRRWAWSELGPPGSDLNTLRSILHSPGETSGLPGHRQA